MSDQEPSTAFRCPFYVRGRVFEGAPYTPREAGTDPSTKPLDLNELVWRSDVPLPLHDIPVFEIIEVLAAVGEYVREDPDGVMAGALAALVAGGASAALQERAYAELWRGFDPASSAFQLEQELGGADALDRWRRVVLPDLTVSAVRAFGVRMMHVLAGNAPGVAAVTIVRSALLKGVSLLKLPSNDLFTAPALLRAISAVAPGHPIERSFAAVYWRGGDQSTQSVLLRSQFFDKMVVWGGAEAVKAVSGYAAPGLDMVSFDPKSSISFIGQDAFGEAADLRVIAALAATDATLHNQDACTASRFQYVQGTVEQVDTFCELLAQELNVERPLAADRSSPVPEDLREEIEGLRELDPYYRVFGRADGTGMVVRSDEPVSFYPTGRVVNVVMVADPKEMLQYVNAATQTVGIYPDRARAELRDLLCAAGVQRITALGSGGDRWIGLPHDGFYPMSRMVRWAKDEGLEL
jgi:hypothetical protein